jgi:transcriptional regulator with XRE-family HTH domain
MLEQVRRKWGQTVRTRRGRVTQKELAARTGLDQGTISRIERGVASLSDESKVKIAEALTCPVGELFGWPEPDKATEPRR